MDGLQENERGELCVVFTIVEDLARRPIVIEQYGVRLVFMPRAMVFPDGTKQEIPPLIVESEV